MSKATKPLSPMRLKECVNSASVSDSVSKDYVLQHVADQLSEKPDKFGRRRGEMFWPPRLVEGLENRSLLPFVGSGVSMAAGFPNWIGLLRQVGLDPEVESDPHAQGDMLTLAELAAQTSGPDQLQDHIRDALSTNREPTTTHQLLAAMFLPVYITTNYDTLLEGAFEQQGRAKPQVITKDGDVLTELGASIQDWEDRIADPSKAPILVKMHGCISNERRNEHLILTRSDYRRHYRQNERLTDFIKYLLRTRRTLFLGFSHRDPEITRLTEDVVHEVEDKNLHADYGGLYSLQFDMLAKTPEVFAARGIVALRPPLVLQTDTGQDARTCALGRGIVDLFAQCHSGTGTKLNLHSALEALVASLDTSLGKAIEGLGALQDRATQALAKRDPGLAQRVADDAIGIAKEFAQQGAYLVDEDGQILAASAPGLKPDERIDLALNRNPDGFVDRPYFRQAKSLGVAFVSDAFPSIYNHNLTVAVCAPAFDAGIFKGILFCAFHPGRSSVFKDLLAAPRPPETSLFVMDANGVLLVPSNASAAITSPVVVEVPGENKKGNEGHPHWSLLQESRIDSRVKRLSENVVPLGQDDDLFRLSSDMLAYSLVAELKHARWKVALCKNLGT